MCAGNPAVSVNGNNLCSWSFDAMNVLTWAEEAGVASAWLQFMALPGGSIFMGALKTPDTPEDAGAANQLDSHAQQSDFVNPKCGQERKHSWPAAVLPSRLYASGLAEWYPPSLGPVDLSGNWFDLQAACAVQLPSDGLTCAGHT